MTPRKLQKKKQREKEVRKMMNLRRARQSVSVKGDRDWEEQMLRESRLGDSPKLKPYRKPEDPEEKRRKSMAQLEHNLKILQALEEEYEREEKARQENNEDGKTLAEKMAGPEKGKILLGQH